MPRVSSAENPALEGVHDVADLIEKGTGYVGGRKRKGKSNLMKYLHVGAPPDMVSIIVNPHGERVPGSRVVHNAKEVIQAMREGYRKLDWHLPPLDEPGGLEKARALLQEFWRWVKSRGERPRRWLLMLFLEAHRYAPMNHAYGPVEAFTCEGGKFGVHTVAESQRPQQINTNLIEETDWMAFLIMKKAGAHYLKQKGIPYNEFESHVQQKYHFVIVDDTAWTPFIPVPNMD